MHERPSYSKHARSQHGRLLSLPTDLQVLLQDSTHGHPPTHDESKSGGLRGLCSNSSVLFEMEPEGFGHHGASGSVQSLNASLSPFQRPLIQHQASFSSSVLNSIIINGGPVHGRASIPAQSAISEHPPPLLSRPAECLLSLCLPYDDLSHLLVQQLRRLRPIAGGTTSQSVEDLATDLLSLGYLIQARDGGTSSSSSSGGVGKKAQEAPQGGGVQQANARAANSLRSLRHCFLVCTGWHQTSGSREAVLLEEPLIVEPRFKEQFLIANPTRAYEELLQAVPISFVGNLGRLRAAVQILGSEIAEAFRQQNRSLPPWRTPEALLSKWAPAQMEDLRKLMQHAASMPPPVTAHYERPPTPHLGTAASVSQFHTASSLTNFPCYRALAKQSAAGRRPGCGGVMCNGVTFQEVQGQQQGCPALSQHGEEGLGQLGLTAAALPLQVLPLLPQELKGVFGSEAKRRPTHSRNSSLGRALQPCSSSSSSIPNFDLQGAPLESCSCPSDSHAAALAGAGGGGGYIQGAGGGDSMVCNDCDGGIAAADAGVGAHNNGSNAGSADPSDCHCGRGDILEGCSGSRGGSNGSGGSSSGKDSDNKCHTARQSKGVNLAKGLGLMRSSSSSLNLKDGVHGTGGDAAMFRLCQQQQRSILRAPTSRMSMPIWQSQELSPSGQASCTLSVMRSQDLNAHGAVEGPSQASPVAKHDTHGFADVIECPSQTGVVANQGSHGPAHVEGPSQAGAVANHDSCRLANVALKAGHKAAGVSAAEEQQQQQQQQREEESANGGGVVEISSSNSSSSQLVELLNQEQQQQQHQQQRRPPALQVQPQGSVPYSYSPQGPLSPLKFSRVSSQDLRHQVQQSRGQTKSALATALRTQVDDSFPVGHEPTGPGSSVDGFPFILHLPDAHKGPQLHHMHLTANGAGACASGKSAFANGGAVEGRALRHQQELLQGICVGAGLPEVQQQRQQQQGGERLQMKTMRPLQELVQVRTVKWGAAVPQQPPTDPQAEHLQGLL